MQSWADEQQEQLRERFPGWEVWYVRGIYPKPFYSWHARPVGAPAATVGAWTPEQLAGQIEQAENAS